MSLQWLREWVDVGNDVPALAHALTMAGLEIEGIERAAPEVSGIVVGEVLSTEKHPNAEKLSVCRVWSGVQELQIVCGASNVRAGLKAPLALVGARLPDGTEIKAAKLRGVESAGMLCSAKELGIDDGSSGLLELAADARTGAPIAEVLHLDDQIFEVSLTPNRGDCMSIAGVAREVAAARQTPWKIPFTADTVAMIDDRHPVQLQAGSVCPKFVGRVIRGLKAGARSPWWLKERLRRAGLRPISAVVDVTNYVMLELGQPMHAYDLRRLDGAVQVRFAKPDEALTLLDGRTIALAEDVAVIADSQRALGLAGVMGGKDSGITDDTVDVFLEGAYFDPDSIAGRGRRYGLVTDASQRFERGVDPLLQELANERATQLLIQIAGGQAGPMVVTSEVARLPKRPPIRLRRERVNALLGITLTSDEISALLQRLYIDARRQGEEWDVSSPSWRFDLRIEEDLVEEIARLYGFDRIPETPANAIEHITAATERRISTQRATQLLIDRGYSEAITYSFTDPQLQRVLFPGESGLALANPISAELAVMRVSLWPGLLLALRENQRRQSPRVRLFEIGRAFASASGAETERIAGIAAGALYPEQWAAAKEAVDFFDVKADVEALLALTSHAQDFSFRRESHSSLHPGQSAQIYFRGQPAGWIGALHPRLLKVLDLTYGAILFELRADLVLQAALPVYREISKYPAIRRDLAVVVAEAIELEQIRSAAKQTAGRLLHELSVFDVYRGTGIEKGKKSIALGFTLQDTSRTLTDEEADAILSRVAEHLRSQLGASIRDKQT